MSTPLSFSHRMWFTATFLFGLAFVFMLPPFHINDEDQHWFRAWTINQGDLYCDKIPEVALELPSTLGFVVFADHQRFHKANKEAIWGALDWRGYNIATPFRCGACGAFPLGYLPSALAARWVAFTWAARPRVGGMIKGFYAARLANFVMVTLGFLLLLKRVPRARNVALFVYSIPEVLQQSVSLGLDAHLFFLACVMLVCATGPPRFRTAAVMIGVATAMTLAKPIYAAFGALALPGLARLRGRSAWLSVLCAAAALLVPYYLHTWWTHSVPAATNTVPGPVWVHPEQQIAFLKENPFSLVSIMWTQLTQSFGTNLMLGRWTGMFAAFGWSAVELPLFVNLLLLLGLVLAVRADLGSDGKVAGAGLARIEKMAWLAAVGGVLVSLPAVVLGMYVYYSKPGAPQVIGVQGRYYLMPLMTLAVLAVWAIRRPKRGSELEPSMIAGICAFANVVSLGVMHAYFW